ncbi:MULTISPECIES: CAP domain-containing protein [Calothrix]|uniref:Peptidase inhibitor family I36 protein n=2 Tax=Calothrix TaxID=1186 RepID=A0ABR8A6C5_9CYAN|nr:MULTISPECIES: CAP domain-containing protein [Calothrix]MBD2194621.1 peptidase inhibitor family I36 protein [Calothrix parietina FACHB-288]MBD2223273.1 peptidase inhibitor family I36 protein [Calothrix anomala FACHB-343]
MGTGDQVIVYDDSQYGGFAQTLAAGNYDWGQIHNDTISSLKVPPGMQVTLYSNTRFQGRSKTFTQDTPYVGDDFNDQTSSIKVELINSNNQVIVYDDSQYRGFAQTLNVGSYYDWGQIHNDTISSLKVPPGIKVTLYSDTNFQGRSKTFTEDTPYVGDDFNDLTSSIKVENDNSSNVVSQMLNLVNQERSAAGLTPLTLNSQLTTAAQAHSQDMADHNFMGHNGSDGSSPFDRIKREGYYFSTAAENVAAGQSTPEDAMSSWMNETPPNDGHRQNILNPNYREIGIGYAYSNATQYKHYWTQDFATR